MNDERTITQLSWRAIDDADLADIRARLSVLEAAAGLGPLVDAPVLRAAWRDRLVTWLRS